MDNESEKEERRVYRARFLPVFLVLFACILVWGVIYFLAGWLTGHLITSSLFITTVMAIPMTWVVMYLYPTSVSRHGIRSYTSLGLHRFCEWQAIASVKPVNILGLRYIRIIPQAGSAIWIPLFLSHSEDFRKDVAAFAQSPENPLVQLLAETKSSEEPEQ